MSAHGDSIWRLVERIIKITEEVIELPATFRD